MGKVRKRNFREAEARRARVVQKCRLQDEQRVGGGDFVERRVQCGDEERVPECAAFAGALFIAPEPIFEGIDCRVALPLSLSKGQGDSG